LVQKAPEGDKINLFKTQNWPPHGFAHLFHLFRGHALTW